MPTLERVIPEDNAKKLLLSSIPDENYNKKQLILPDFNKENNGNSGNDNSDIGLPGGSTHHQHQVNRPHPTDNGAFGFDQDDADAINQLAVNGDGGLGGRDFHALASVAVRQLFHVCASDAKDKNTTEGPNSSAASNLSNPPFDENVIVPAAPGHTALPCLLLFATPALASPLPLNTQPAEDPSVCGGDGLDMVSSSPVRPSSLLLCREYHQASTPPVRALHHSPGLFLPSSRSGSHRNDSFSSVDTSSSQDSLYESHDVGVANTGDQYAFSAVDWTLYSDSSLTFKSPALTSTSYPSLFASYTTTPGLSPPTNNHPCDQTRIAESFSLASTPLPALQATSTISSSIGVQSLVAAQPIDHTFPHSSVFLSTPIEVVAGSVTEYTQSQPNTDISTLHNALPTSVLPRSIIPYPQVSYCKGSEYRPSPLGSSTMDMYYPNQPAPLAVDAFSTWVPLVTESSSCGFVPIQPNYNQMPTSNSVFSLPPMNIGGYSSTATNSGCKNHAQFPCPCDVDVQNRLVDVSTRLADSTLKTLSHSFAKTQNLQADPYFNVCSNCGTTEAPSWRRCRKSLTLLCNACGLYQNQHGKPRPVFRAKDGTIRMLRGTTEHEPCTICKATQSAFWKKNADNDCICNACYQIARQSESLACEATMAATVTGLNLAST
ncbi:hypothetical protein BGX24_008590 [Mortierella sp. AD032]|nr:hypothetical protein BGX24_008590 [Mortierella sp. AD032]